MGVKEKTSANLAGLLALSCRTGEFSCVPPHNEEEKQGNTALRRVWVFYNCVLGD